MKADTSTPAMIGESPSIARRVRTVSASSMPQTATSVSSPTKTTPSKGKSQRKSSSLPSETVEYLKAWMMSPEHVAHPYPTEQEKAQIMADTGIELKQLTNWFVNNRKRYWKPRVEARLHHQAQAQAATTPTIPTVAPSQEANSRSSDSSSDSSNSRYGSPVNTGSYIALDMTQPSALLAHRILPSGDDATAPQTQQKVVSSVPTTELHQVSEASSASSESDNQSFTNDTDDEMSNSAAPSIKTMTTTTSLPEKSVMTPSTVTKRARSVTEESPMIKRKRSIDEYSVYSINRTKFMKKSPTMWREACVEANHAYDDALPSLEEAAHLFGYTIQSS